MERNIKAAPREAASVRTAKALFFTGAGFSLVASIYLFFTGDAQNGIFVGLWVPSILSGGALLLGGPSHG